MNARSFSVSLLSLTIGLTCSASAFAQPPSPVPTVASFDAATLPEPSKAGEGIEALARHLGSIAEFAGSTAGSYARSLQPLVKAYSEISENPLRGFDPETCKAIESATELWVGNRLATELSAPARRAELKVQFESARLCGSRGLHDAALRNLGSALTFVRADTWDARTQIVLIRYTTVNALQSLTGLDARYALPLLETLFDIADYQAMHRVLEMVPARTAAADFERYRTVVNAQPLIRIENDLPTSCKPMLDGEAVRGKSIELRAGSRVLVCEGDASARVIAVNGSIQRLSEAPTLFSFPSSQE